MELLHLSVGDLPDLPAKWKVTDWDAEGKRRITVTESGFIPAVTDATPDYLLLLPIIKKEIITGLTAPPKDAPVKQQDGTWDYTVDRNGDGFVNSAVLTFKVNPKTGVFTGKFTLWYDYISAYDFTKDTQKLAHTSKAVSFQGVMVPNSFGGTGSIRGGGYFLWPEQGEYDTGKLDRNGNPVMRSYKYKCSHLFEIVNPN